MTSEKGAWNSRLFQASRASLDRYSDALDQQVKDALAESRRQALEQARPSVNAEPEKWPSPPRRRWLLAWNEYRQALAFVPLAAAFFVVVGVIVSLSDAGGGGRTGALAVQGEASPVDSMFAAEDAAAVDLMMGDSEFLDDLEFYAWLEAQALSGDILTGDLNG